MTTTGSGPSGLQLSFKAINEQPGHVVSNGGILDAGGDLVSQPTGRDKNSKETVAANHKMLSSKTP